MYAAEGLGLGRVAFAVSGAEVYRKVTTGKSHTLWSNRKFLDHQTNTESHHEVHRNYTRSSSPLVSPMQAVFPVKI